VAVARADGCAPMLSIALSYLARTILWAYGAHDPRPAELLDGALRLAEAVQARYAIGYALMTLGDLAWRQGVPERALPHWRRALEVRSELADRRGVAGSLERLAWWLAASADFRHAAWVFGAAGGQHSLLGIELRLDEEVDHTHLVAQTRASLGRAFAALWTEGQAAPLETAVARALAATCGAES
jgi:hypothetical protein